MEKNFKFNFKKSKVNFLIKNKLKVKKIYNFFFIKLSYFY